MKLTLEIWRQAGPDTDGHFETVQVDDAVEQMSILELLDHVNNNLVEDGKEPFVFASDSVSYTHLTLPTIHVECRSRWSPYH